jgi:glycosyltransferase involved in cell wall biosynthesis
LLVATDNTFYQTSEGVWDAFCFDRAFFDDYRAVFEDVTVAARMRLTPPPLHAHRSDGGRVEFVGLTDVHGARWALAPMRVYCRGLLDAVKKADAVCIRIPAVSGVFAARLARRFRKPLMFELIGDPELALASFGINGILLGKYFATWTRRVVRDADVGSYVSFKHLQHRYPPGSHTLVDSISSVRLPESEIRPARIFPSAPVPLRVVLVASLLACKDHETLLIAAHEARRLGVLLHLDLIGDGPLRDGLAAVARRLELDSVVTFHGHVAGRERVTELLDGADLFVMPSLAEGMPRAMIEAMARGLPTLGADIPAIRELLPAEQMFPTKDPQSLARLLLDAQRAPERLTRWAAHSGKTVKQFAKSALSDRRIRLLSSLRHAVSSRGSCDA